MKPIQEDKEDVSSSGRFCRSSLVESLMEADLIQSLQESATGPENSITLNDLQMSIDSATLEALMRKSQSTGEMNIFQLVACCNLQLS